MFVTQVNTTTNNQAGAVIFNIVVEGVTGQSARGHDIPD